MPACISSVYITASQQQLHSSPACCQHVGMCALMLVKQAVHRQATIDNDKFSASQYAMLENPVYATLSLRASVCWNRLQSDCALCRLV